MLHQAGRWHLHAFGGIISLDVALQWHYVYRWLALHAALHGMEVVMRDKDTLLQMRVKMVQKAIIKVNATREGYTTITDFVLSRCLPEKAQEVVESPAEAHPIAPESAARVIIEDGAMSRAERLAALIPGGMVKTGGQVFGGSSVPGEDGKDKVVRRPFNPRRRDWYELIRKGDAGWWEVLQDVLTGQVWAVVNGKAKEFTVSREAIEYCQNLEMVS